MNDPRLDEILRLLDPPPGNKLWFGGASPLGCLRGVTPEQAVWKPAPERPSIWAYVLHMAYWKYAVRRSLLGLEKGSFPRSPADWPKVPDVADAAAWKKDRALLRSEHQQLVAALRKLDPAKLDEKTAETSRKYRFIDLFHGIIQHDTYHTAQIQLLKRLYPGPTEPGA